MVLNLLINNIFNNKPSYNYDTSQNFLNETFLKFDFLANIDLLSYLLLMILIVLFVKNYYSSNSIKLSNILQVIIKSSFVLFIMNILFYMFVGGLYDFYLAIAVLVTLFLFLGLANFFKTLSLNQTLSEYIILSFIVLCFGWSMIGIGNKDFALLLICLEGFSLSLYIMATIGRTFGGVTAAIKYFTFGTIGSVLMLWGAVNFYEMLGSLNSLLIIDFINYTNLVAININQDFSNKITWSSILILSGFLIKLGAAPIHQWVPDVYAGVSTVITAFYSLIVKFILFILFLDWAIVFNNSLEIEYVSLLSIIIGCFGTLRQVEIKRFLAYGSITHMGYLLMGDLISSWMYITVYLLASFLFFSVILNLKLNGQELMYLQDIRFVGQSLSPWDRFLLIIAVSSMAGLPPFAGFYGKMFVWVSLIEDIYLYNDLLSFILLFFNLVTSLLIIFYYVRVMAYLCINDETKQELEVESHDFINLLNYKQELVINDLDLTYLKEKSIKYIQIMTATFITLWTLFVPSIITLFSIII
jgi:NADH-quinone oxidoreductase subunit N